MKYIVMQVDVTKELAREDIILFPDELVHSDMAELMKRGYGRSHRSFSKVVSAGFVNSLTSECYGESESLNIKSRGDSDTALLISGKYGLNLVNKS